MSKSKLAEVVDVTDCRTIGDMLDKSHTNWDVEKRDPGASDNSGGFRCLVRPDTDTVVACVGPRFAVNNHRAQLMALEGLVEAGTIQPVSVSVWDDGATLAYQLRCPGLDVTVHDKDMVSPLLTLAFSYGSRLADSAFFSDFRWFCKNQLGKVAVLAKDSRVKHRGGVIDRFAELIAMRVGEIGGELSSHYNTMRRMVQKELTGMALAKYFGQSVGLEGQLLDLAINAPANSLKGDAGKVPEILECYQTDDCGAKGSVWHAYNAVTRYETHHSGRTVATRQRRMLLGPGQDTVHRAWEYAEGMVAA